MANTKLSANGNLTAWWVPNGGFANYLKPTTTEISAGIDITQAISWQDFSFGIQASNKNSDPSWADSGNPQTRGFGNFGGTISFFFPAAFDVALDNTFLTWDALDQPGTLGYVVIRVDGTKVTATPVANDFVRVYYVQTDGWAEVNTGEVNFRYSVTFLPQGSFAVDAIVATTAPVPLFTMDGGATMSLASSPKKRTTAYLTGRQLATQGYPGRFTYATSTPTLISVDANGLVTALAVGTASATATDKYTGAVSTALSITVSA